VERGAGYGNYRTADRVTRVFATETAANLEHLRLKDQMVRGHSTVVEKRIATFLDDKSLVLLSREVFLPIEKLEV
jgi:hypothetical protein